MIWRDRWFQIFIVTKNKNSLGEKKYIVGKVNTKTKNAIKAHCTVDIEQNVTGIAASATIVLSGLKSTTMYLLASELARYIQDPHYAYVEINAGYSNNHGVIYRGSVMTAVTDMDNADYKITLSCIGLANVDNGNPISASEKGLVDARELVRKIAEERNMIFDDRSNSHLDYQIDGLCGCNMSLSQFFTMLTYNNRKFGINVEQGSVLDDSGRLANGRITFFDANSSTIIDNTLENKTKVLDDSWIVGTPIINTLGAHVRIRFRPDIFGLDCVKIKSNRFPQIGNTYFVVQQVATKLDTKGSTWYKDLYLCYPEEQIVGRTVVFENGGKNV